MALISVPDAAARVRSESFSNVTKERLLAAAQRGSIPAILVGARYKIDEADIAAIGQYFAQIDASRAVAARLTHERNMRREKRLADLQAAIEAPPEWVDVDKVTYRRHEKEGRPPSLRVSYRCGIRFFNEWVAIEGDGRAHEIACLWWKKHSGSTIAPANVDEALCLIKNNALKKPHQILTRCRGEFWNVVGHRFRSPEG